MIRNIRLIRVSVLAVGLLVGSVFAESTAPAAHRDGGSASTRETKPGLPSRIVLILDGTGAMKSKFDDVRIEVHLMTEALRPSQCFNIVLFQQDIKEATIGKELLACGTENKKKILDFLDRVVPSGAACDPIPAIKSAFEMKPEAIYFLCGPREFPDTRAVIDAFRTLNPDRAIVVNTISYGKRDENFEKVLAQIANDAHGQFRPMSETDTDSDK